MTAWQTKEDIEAYNGLMFELKRYTDVLQQFRDNADNIAIHCVKYSYKESGLIHDATFEFCPYRNLSVQAFIDSLEQNIKGIMHDMADIRDKYKGVIDFED